MPPAPAAPPPPASAPAAGQKVTIVEGPPPPPPPAPTRAIQVSQMPASADPPKEPAKGSAMDRLRADLAKRAKQPGTESPAQKPTQAAESKPASDKAAQKPEGAEASDKSGQQSPPEGETQTTPPPAGETSKTGKTNPWKLVDTYKAKVSDLEKQIAESKTTGLAEKQRTEFQERISTLEKTNKELADEIRYVNFQKHPEFIEQFQKPYEAAWKRAMSELDEITFQDPQTGQSKNLTPQDLLALVQLPLAQARELSKRLFGDFADDVMGHRKEIRALFQAQQQALEKVRTEGANRDKQAQEQHQRIMSELQTSIVKTWETENSEIIKDPAIGRFISQAEGDDEGNAKLAKGFELFDSSFTLNPLDPKLSPEQRADIVKRHAALRNRAAAFGKLVSMVSKLEAERAALMKELEQYKSSTPPTGGQVAPPSGQTAPRSARDEVFAALRARAKAQ